jgi:hypothetical protein
LFEALATKAASAGAVTVFRDRVRDDGPVIVVAFAIFAVCLLLL